MTPHVSMPRLIHKCLHYRLTLARTPLLVIHRRPTNPHYIKEHAVRENSSIATAQSISASGTMASQKDGPKPKPQPSIARPSSSIVLISPKNEVLLLHRVKTSTSFASAHVFPGGNLSDQDGKCPPVGDPKRHDDAIWYRNAAVRELFEESGILLAKDQKSGKMLVVPESKREEGRKKIHRNEVTFTEWLKQQNPAAVPDTEQLIPFTRWITPTNVPKRYSTQMYLYFLPLPFESDKSLLSELPAEGEREEIQIPTSDGGIEVTEARFLPASEWLRLAGSGDVIMFPPQIVLLHLVSQFLDQAPRTGNSVDELRRRRAELVDFVHTGNPPWTEKCISPKMLKMSSDGRTVLALDHPGPELKGTDRQGEPDRVVLVKFAKGTARQVEVRWKKDVFSEDKERSSL
ncbi:NUDIX family hydrolase [Aspergillus nomiae NRRL 13137]|uniref:NUDIX family hydrolase n=1 Tax=Aspergillus nomiae NRRL (strain ATCC 15546 / NRRL 13137 / CBS 260.88 / M93) TaxID=1509407 RepID=A0A0L1J8I5_ASPN3|nr:NUDIX family hydrolase [Aspergillus nomiae NRRL 13137]KNG87985.1 NUDIX family hydrolase [Aspergillus nomiae NRRL 13137]